MSHHYMPAMPGVLLWKKDLHSMYIEVSNETANVFGYNAPDKMLGTTDFDTPCKLSQFADIFRAHDRQVIDMQQPLRLLEIHPIAGDNWKIFLTTKAANYNDCGRVIGTTAVAVDISTIITSIPSIVSKLNIAQNTYHLDSPLHALHLTHRENEYAFYIARGKTAKEIAKIYNLSVRTVEHHFEKLKLKLHVTTKSELMDLLIVKGYLNYIPAHFLSKQTSIIL